MSMNLTDRGDTFVLPLNWLNISMKAQQKKKKKKYNRSFTEQVMMPAIQFVKPKPANTDTIPGIMSLNLDPWATGTKTIVVCCFSSVLFFFPRHIQTGIYNLNKALNTQCLFKLCRGSTIMSSDFPCVLIKGELLWVHLTEWGITLCANIVLSLCYNNPRAWSATCCVRNSWVVSWTLGLTPMTDRWL